MHSYINIKSIHLPLSQLVTADCTIQEGKLFSIGSNSVIVTRYRLDSKAIVRT